MKFILGVLAGMVLGVGIFAGLVSLAVGTPMVETRGIAGMGAAKINIARQIGEPKVLFVGGSSVDLGISAEQAEQQLGRPAVNMGLIAPLGAKYLTDQVKKVAVEGDVVVLALEYNLYDWPGASNLWLDPMFVQYVTAQDAAYLEGLPWWYRANILARLSNAHLATVLLRGREGKPPALENMNSRGDRTDNTPEKRPENAPARKKPLDQLKDGLSSSPKGLAALEEFGAWAKESGVHVVATFPNVGLNTAYNDETLEAVEKQITMFYESLGISVVGNLRGAMFSEEDCFDTPFHLIAPAVERRTADLCEALKPHLLAPWSDGP
jgi:hypothetical protein